MLQRAYALIGWRSPARNGKPPGESVWIESELRMPSFTRYVGIDYSGARTPTSSLKGLRVYLAEQTESPSEVAPPASRRKYWTRRDIAEWLVAVLVEDGPIAVGIDHGFSFPREYFDTHGLLLDWVGFLEDFHRHWPTDQDLTSVEQVRRGLAGNGVVRGGKSTWRRLAEKQTRGAKSVFHFDVPGSVGKSTHAGIPWLRFIRRTLGSRVHFWPFDGWEIPAGRSVVAEVYPALWSRDFPRENRTPDQHDAFSVAAWLLRADRDESLSAAWTPDLTPAERAVAQFEGWILGVPGLIHAGPAKGAARPKR